MVDPNETAEDRAKAERFQCWRSGYRDGFMNRREDPRFIEHARREIWENYRSGYTKGRDQWLIASYEACERFGYNPMARILREQPPKAEALLTGGASDGK